MLSKVEGIKQMTMLHLPFISHLVKGGIPEGSNILLIGPPGSGKTVFCEYLAKMDLWNSCLFVVTDRKPEDVRLSFQGNWGYPGGKIVFVDAFSWLLGKSKEEYHIENMGNLTELNFRILSAGSSLIRPPLLVFDAISPLSLYNSETFVTKFLQLLLARVKEWKGLGIYVVQEGVHSEEFYNTLGYMADGIFDIKMAEEEGKIKRYFRIRSFNSVAHETGWVLFSIKTDRTIELRMGGAD